MFDPDNMLGTGLTLLGFLLQGRGEQFIACLTEQPIEERRRRWHFIKRMMFAYKHLLDQFGHVPSSEDGAIPEGFFGSAITCDKAIEAMWSGDWQGLKDVTNWISYEGLLNTIGDSEEEARLWADRLQWFRKICIEAYETRPEGGSTTKH